MAYGLYISAEGALAQSRRLETISNNLANVDTVGFKRDLAIFQSRFAEATARGLDQSGSGSINDVGGGVELTGTLTDYSSGPLQKTDGETDLAIPGRGFFVVRKNGEDLLTRAGNFLRTAEGALITQAGDPVLSADGAPVVIDDRRGPWSFTEDGSVQQLGASIPLAIVEPASLGDLTKVGENFFRSLAPTQAVEPSARRVLPGHLEGSGVRATEEMMEMIQASRAFEANVNLVRNQDQALGTLISRVLKS